MLLYILNCTSQWIVAYRQVQLRVVQILCRGLQVSIGFKYKLC